MTRSIDVDGDDGGDYEELFTIQLSTIFFGQNNLGKNLQKNTSSLFGCLKSTKELSLYSLDSDLCV